MNPPKLAVRPMKKKTKPKKISQSKTKLTQPKLQPRDNSQPNIKVTRHNGPSNSLIRAENHEERKKKEDGEMSLAAALSRVGIVPVQPLKKQKAQKKSSQKAHGVLQAAQTETFTEVKTLYRFNYQVK